MERPEIHTFKDPASFVNAMIRYRKSQEKSFSVLQSTKNLRRVSPALISLIIKNKRAVTLDRVDELSKLLALNSTEKYFFKNWISQEEEGEQELPAEKQKNTVRKKVSISILNDWLNIYVKDFFQIKAVQKNLNLVKKQFAHVASTKRIERSIEFLLREGHLRKKIDGSIVIDTNFADVDPKVSSKKIRQFHKGALKMAQLAVDLFPPSERLANTLIIAMDEEKYEELMALTDEFAEKLKQFAENNNENGNRLYQVILNVSPTGGKIK